MYRLLFLLPLLGMVYASSNGPLCLLDPDGGSCGGKAAKTGRSFAWYHDRLLGKYSGCGGNVNRFSSYRSCSDRCSRAFIQEIQAASLNTKPLPSVTLTLPPHPQPPIVQLLRPPITAVTAFGLEQNDVQSVLQTADAAQILVPRSITDHNEGQFIERFRAWRRATVHTKRTTTTAVPKIDRFIETLSERKENDFPRARRSCTSPKYGGLPCTSDEEDLLPQHRFYWNAAKQMCLQFLFTGCAGNGNNFATFTECNALCGQDRSVCLGGVSAFRSLRAANCSTLRCPHGYVCRGGDGVNAACCPRVIERERHCPDSQQSQPYVTEEGHVIYADECNDLECVDGWHCAKGMFAKCCRGDGDGGRSSSSGIDQLLRRRGILTRRRLPTTGRPRLTAGRPLIRPGGRGAAIFRGSIDEGDTDYATSDDDSKGAPWSGEVDTSHLPTLRPPSTPRRRTHEGCALPLEVGPCPYYAKRWYFDEEKGECDRFEFGGCGGNGNNFLSAAMCRLYCEE